MLCKIYIYGLDKKIELMLRQKLFLSGARFATSIRFVSQPSEACIWVVRFSSELIDYAKKRAAKQYLMLWLCDDLGNIYLPKNKDEPITTKKMAQIIDMMTVQLHKKASENSIEDTIKANNAKLVSHLRMGLKQKKGKLFLQYKDIKLLIDFTSAQVKVNDAFYDARVRQRNFQFDFTAFEVLPAPPSVGEMKHSLDAFAAAWEIMQNSLEKRLIIPLSDNTPLMLNQWPSFEAVEHDFEDYKLASFLQKRALSANQLAQVLQLSDAKIFAFLNAVYIAGLADAIAAPEEPEEQSLVTKKSANSLVSLWRKVRANFTTS